VEEELRDDEVGPGVHLALEVFQVVVETRRLGVTLGVARHADGKPVVCLDERHELVGEPEAPRGPDELLLAPGRVAAQGEDVLDALRLHVVEDAGDVVP